MSVPSQRIRVVSAVIMRDQRYLITQRTAKAVLPLLWEFPGGRVEAGETDVAALVRELSYRLGVDAQVGQKISTAERAYREYTVQLHLYACDLGAEAPQARRVHDLRWVTSEEFDLYEFTPADQGAMDALLFRAKS